MTNDAVIIVGAGHAGAELAHALRKEGFEGRVVLVSDEPHVPYQKPPLSKDFLKGDGVNPLLLKAEALYGKLGIELLLGRSVTDIDREARAVHLDDGTRLDYGHLVLATGARNRRLPLPGLDDPAVMELRGLDHCRAILSRAPGLEHVAVVGAGFIGLEIAAFLREKGKAVDVIELADRVMARAVSEPVSAWFRALHEGMGTTIHLKTGVTAIVHEAGGVRVELSDGRSLAAGAVLLAAGVVPNVELAQAAGLEIADGIVVDEMLLTSDPSISALGDCAAFPCVHGEGRVRLESVQNANDQARAIARRLTGHPAPYTNLPWFWSHQGPARLQIAGLSSGYDQTVLRGDPAADKFSVFLYRKGRLIAVESVNAPADHLAARRLLDKGITVPPDVAADPEADLKALAV
ncbi:3-phenylpropionate/trans-cinnamate dioxygenase ferredoxin reductase subunit [Amorphus suaedae]